ncbi:MAG: c-type cytochrome [Chitinophagales bacterium]|nr:c-type cytochrome [Chitinophagales bacterium]MDW8393824.1 c-type cytochrome [Chitinophagales bacterium]
MERRQSFNEQTLRSLQRSLHVLIVTFIIGFAALVMSWNKGYFTSVPVTEQTGSAVAEASLLSADLFDDPSLWRAPDLSEIADEEHKKLVTYGRELIAHTSRYLGPKGSVMQMTNGMNCQNCHLDAGTRPWGNNYGSVASTYPKFRPRSGSIENIYKRVNDCIQRSLNGKPLDTLGREMQAIKAYIEFLGSNVEKGKRAEGSGLKDLAFLDRAADPKRGKEVYVAKCQSCHQADGSGLLNADSTEYIYPPLWGPNSYNDAAGLYRITHFAKFVKNNMPLGATFKNPLLTDEEAYDVAAYVNSQPRPHLPVPHDWPDISKKPIDHPFGPYADSFSEEQHKYGPWKPIEEERKKREALAATAAKPGGK